MAALQSKTLMNNQRAYNVSQATQMSYGIADKIRANVNQISNYKIADSSTAQCKTSDLPCTACRSASKACTAAEMATRDLYDWHLDIKAALGSTAKGIISDDATKPGVYTVTIQWDDDRNGTIDTNEKYYMSFRL